MYITLAELKARIEIPTTDVDHDAELTALIVAAGAAIDKFTNRPDGYEALSVATARLFVGRGQSFLLIDESVEITKVETRTVSETTFTVWTNPATATALDGDYIPAAGDPRFPVYGQTPYDMLIVDTNGDYSYFDSGYRCNHRFGFWQSTPVYPGPGVPTVRVTAKWGYSVAAPTPIREATGMQAARWFKRLQGAMADSLASTDFGQPAYIQTLDPDVKAILYTGRMVKPMTGVR
ncbi:MAG: phage gp6-like head-tail connector protein [Planctomycetes bacterium]|nr:phage gp6-like head-tail connector protein [Planctomycetota bacterium]